MFQRSVKQRRRSLSSGRRNKALEKESKKDLTAVIGSWTKIPSLTPSW